ncbi:MULTISPECIES: Bax inhibitor-1/YccA family protein [Kiloniella]|uniref:Membrane protein n=1 Tax=Kiloniella spongiae TaxID=1489064 RepID=A0A0H2MEU4_9PROT|nr:MULTISPECIES: Bax inhibitor-1/YccA family protein [Kiloniella]KLN60731.1 membrane protein [Kiloniella spongiae]
MIDRSTQRSVGYGQATAADIDAGLRKYMLGVYNYMSIALLITGLAAFGVSQSPELLQLVYGTPLKWVVMLAPLGMVFFLSARIHALAASTAQLLFWVFSVLMGVSISYIFIAYTGESIVRVFFITAASFAGLSLVGYTTKKNLSAFGSFLTIGLIGIVIASIVNIFLASSGLSFVISILGVLIFAGLTAYDTQRIKLMYMESDHSEVAQKKSIMGALSLYLNFLNMFLFLLQLFGNRE